MKFLRRIIRAARAQLEMLANQVEDHESLATAALEQIADAQQAAQRELQVLNSEIQQQARLVESLEEHEARWTQSARTAILHDEDRARECLRQAHQLRHRRANVVERASELKRVAQELISDIETIGQRQQTLLINRDILSARQTRAEALSTLSLLSGEPSGQLNALFQRWERKVQSYERLPHSLTGTLRLESTAQDFDSKAFEEKLNAELEELRKDNT